MKGYIYKYTFPDGKVYIGQTKNLEMRKQQHVSPVSGPSNKGFWEAYQRFGKYEFEVIRELEYEKEDELNHYLGLWEAGYIHQYRATNPDYGYNRMAYPTVRSRDNKILLEKYQEVFFTLVQERLNLFWSAEHKVWKTHEPLTEEEKYLLKERFKGKTQFDPGPFNFDDLGNNNMGDAEWFNLEEYMGEVKYLLEEETRQIANVYVVLHRDEILQEEYDKTAIVQMDKDGNVVREFNSFIEICQAFNVPRADNVRNVLKGKQKTAYGYYWKYKRDL